MAGKINERFFFDQLKLTLFDGSLTAKQVAGLKDILAEWQSQHSRKDDRWLAYALATAHHETGRTMQPIKEWGGDKYFFRMYDPAGQRPDVAKKLGNNQPGDGARFPGRGYVQLTGRTNYTKWARRLDVALDTNPDLALQSKISVKILFDGMEDGSFTTKKFADYFHGNRADWVNARRIINGVDKAHLVASYGLKYYAAISYTT